MGEHSSSGYKKDSLKLWGAVSMGTGQMLFRQPILNSWREEELLISIDRDEVMVRSSEFRGQYR